MSTIVRARRARPLTRRAVRMRNACVGHAAATFGLTVPTESDLRELADDAGLREAIAWWKARAGTAVDAHARALSAGYILLKTGLITAVTLVGLAISYGRAQ